MNPVRVSCTGIQVASVSIPPFELRTGEMVCLHLPAPQNSRADEYLIQLLTGARKTAGLQLLGRVVRAEPARHATGLRNLFRRQRVADWLGQFGESTPAEVLAILDRLGIRADTSVAQLPLTPCILLGLEAAWLRRAEVLVYSTAGLDPLGRAAVFQAVSAHLPECAALHLSYALRDGNRICPPGALCLDIALEAVAGAS
jgi:hypothetical protein